jgi:hypothetical protein
MSALAALLALCAPADAALARDAYIVLTTHCAACHGKAAQRGGISVTDWKALRASGVIPGKADESELVLLVESGTMPPGNATPPSLAERQSLRKWVEAGAPSLPPPESGDEYVLRQIAADWAALPAARKAGARYITLDHLIVQPGGPALVARARKELERVLGGLAAPGKRGFKLEPIDRDGSQESVYRLELSSLGWDDRPFVIPPSSRKDKPVRANLTVFDLFLLEYPLAVVQFGRPFRDTVTFLRATKSVRPIVYVRGDWLLGLLNDRAFAREASLLAGNDDHARLPKPTAREIVAGPVALALARAELNWKGEDMRLKEALRAEGLGAIVDGKTIARDVWLRKFPAVAGRLGLGTPLLPWDGLTAPDCSNDPGLTVKAETWLYELGEWGKTTNAMGKTVRKLIRAGKPIKRTDRFKFDQALALWVTPSKDAIIEVANRNYLDQAEQFERLRAVGAGVTLRIDDGKVGIEVEPPASRESFLVYAFAGGVSYAGRTYRVDGWFYPRVRDRFVHPFYQLGEGGTAFEKPSLKAVKVTASFRTAKE